MAKESDEDEPVIKCFILKLEETGKINGNARIKDENISGIINSDLNLLCSAGMTFKTKNNSGGKAIAQGNIIIKGDLDLGRLEYEFKKLEDYFDDFDDEEKMSEAEFYRYNLPLEIDLRVSFYNDNNVETLNCLEIKSLYDLYSYIFDLIQLGN